MSGPATERVHSGGRLLPQTRTMCVRVEGSEDCQEGAMGKKGSAMSWLSLHQLWQGGGQVVDRKIR